MNKYIKEFLGIAFGAISVLSGLLGLLLLFLFFADGFHTKEPTLLIVSIGICLCTFGLAWKYPQLRGHLAAAWIPTNWIP